MPARLRFAFALSICCSAGLMMTGCFLLHGESEARPAPDPDRDAGAVTPTADSGPPIAPPGPGSDGGTVPAPDLDCDAMDVAFSVCGPSCLESPVYFWNGFECIETSACDLGGADASRVLDSREACEAAFAGCWSSQCHATDGEVVMDSCGHYECGYLQRDCFVPMPGCDCGPGRSFAEGFGCADDGACSRRDLCVATGGQLAECDTMCGLEIDCGVSPGIPGCDCGPFGGFDEERGCIPDNCMADERVVCESSGGLWLPICCHTECGLHCPDACVNNACQCPPNAVYEEGRGCIASPSCRERAPGQFCNEASGMVCAEGYVCCSGVCQSPCCGDTECDEATGCGIAWGA